MAFAVKVAFIMEIVKVTTLPTFMVENLAETRCNFNSKLVSKLNYTNILRYNTWFLF